MPVLIALLFLYASFKKVDSYNVFVKGAKNSVSLVLDVFPFIVAIMVMVALMRASGITNLLIKILSPLFNGLGSPTEVSELVLLRPFTGSGSYAILKDIYTTYGVDTYISRCASVIMGTSETVFYVATVYFSQTSVKKLSYAIPLALLCNVFATVISCLICRIF